MAESLWDGCRAGGEPLRHGRMLMKLDSELAVAGSVETRGGIYEVHCRHGRACPEGRASEGNG